MRRVPLAVALIALAASAASFGDTPLGPQLGNVRWRGEIRFGPEGEDTDSFGGNLLRGEHLSVRVSTSFQSGLLPTLTVLGPDGTERDVGVRSRGIGKSLDVRDFVVPETGRWTVRVGALLQTRGKYTLAIGIRPAAPVRVVVPPDTSGGPPQFADLAFEASDGFRLDLRAKGSGKSAPHVTGLSDPAGDAVRDAEGALVVEAAASRRSTVSLVVDALSAGTGTYYVRVVAPEGNGGFVATARVAAVVRPKGVRRLEAEEPWLAPRTTLLRGVKERPVRLDGLHFSTGGRPVVLFGDTPGTDVSVDPFGTTIDVLPPQLVEGSTVRVAVVNPDGQASERPDFFYYVRTPRVDDIVDPLGAPVRGASTTGGRRVRFVGYGFETGVFARFGVSEDVLPQILDPGTMEFRTPVQQAGTVEIHLYDGYIHDITVPIPFEFKDPPQIGSLPYTPSSPAGNGTVTVTIGGSGFEADDEVLFDGVAQPTQWLTATLIRFTVPVSAPGAHTIAVRDRVDSVTAGPKLTVQ